MPRRETRDEGRPGGTSLASRNNASKAAKSVCTRRTCQHTLDLEASSSFTSQISPTGCGRMALWRVVVCGLWCVACGVRCASCRFAGESVCALLRKVYVLGSEKRFDLGKVHAPYKIRSRLLCDYALLPCCGCREGGRGTGNKTDAGRANRRFRVETIVN